MKRDREIEALRTAEWRRLAENRQRTANWKLWGPYLAERQWGTVREDYSGNGDNWNYFPHDHARSRAYRWGEDGIFGISDRKCRLCFAPAMWNTRDPILKERFFGLSGREGNHGEDVKECYFYLDATPTHSWMEALYKYPQAEYPYRILVEVNRYRGRSEPEFELLDTGIFDNGAYFDIFVQYAKAAPEDILIRIIAVNRSREAAPLHLLPTLWFRNTWSWGRSGEEYGGAPRISQVGEHLLLAEHPDLGEYRFAVDPDALCGGEGRFLFTDNVTNNERLFRSKNESLYVKDAFHEYVIHGDESAVNPAGEGTKAAFWWKKTLQPGERVTLQFRLVARSAGEVPSFGAPFEEIFALRRREADAFHTPPPPLPPEEARIRRQAHAGLLWSKQFYAYVVEEWLEGDPAQPLPPPERKRGRNHGWRHLSNRDILSMPDKWEYPWYAAWDLAFHTIPLASLDPDFAKAQLLLLLREWYMHPNGQIPAYEFNFSDVNPPVHAWAAWRVYHLTAAAGEGDRTFLARVFQKLLLNFTWWVNRKDADGNHLFSGGFLGLDNIGVFDRSRPLPTGGRLEQADATAWMAFYCTTMLAIALELSREDPAYEDMASKFFVHFGAIADAMNSFGGTGLWDETDGFYYDQIQVDGEQIPLRVRSIVGLVPLLAVEVLDESLIERLPGFQERMAWTLSHQPKVIRHTSCLEKAPRDGHPHRLLALPSRSRLERVLRYLFDEEEFLSPFGIRSLSRWHRDHPYRFQVGGREFRVTYVPGESDSDLFGGNANWRGPVWFPLNYLIIEALERYHHFYGEEFKVAFPTGSSERISLGEAAARIARRLIGIFLPDGEGRRPWQGEYRHYDTDPSWRDLHLFHEYFHGETGKGLGAEHQTGWTALVARLIEKYAG